MRTLKAKKKSGPSRRKGQKDTVSTGYRLPLTATPPNYGTECCQPNLTPVSQYGQESLGSGIFTVAEAGTNQKVTLTGLSEKKILKSLETAIVEVPVRLSSKTFNIELSPFALALLEVLLKESLSQVKDIQKLSKVKTKTHKSLVRAISDGLHIGPKLGQDQSIVTIGTLEELSARLA